MSDSATICPLCGKQKRIAERAIPEYPFIKIEPACCCEQRPGGDRLRALKRRQVRVRMERERKDEEMTALTKDEIGDLADAAEVDLERIDREAEWERLRAETGRAAAEQHARADRLELKLIAMRGPVAPESPDRPYWPISAGLEDEQ